jgi:hypothetical protein
VLSGITKDSLANRAVRLRQRAARLLDAFDAEPMKSVIRTAVAHIEEGETWLKSPAAEQRPHILQIAANCFLTAQAILDAADATLLTSGAKAIAVV